LRRYLKSHRKPIIDRSRIITKPKLTCTGERHPCNCCCTRTFHAQCNAAKLRASLLGPPKVGHTVARPRPLGHVSWLRSWSRLLVASLGRVSWSRLLVASLGRAGERFRILFLTLSIRSTNASLYLATRALGYDGDKRVHSTFVPSCLSYRPVGFLNLAPWMTRHGLGDNRWVSRLLLAFCLINF
jgi:hypothetical protein